MHSSSALPYLVTHHCRLMQDYHIWSQLLCGAKLAGLNHHLSHLHAPPHTHTHNKLTLLTPSHSHHHSHLHHSPSHSHHHSHLHHSHPHIFTQHISGLLSPLSTTSSSPIYTSHTHTPPPHTHPSTHTLTHAHTPLHTHTTHTTHKLTYHR